MSILKSELHARKLKKISKDDKCGIIGVEIKNRRKNREQTLEKLSDNICSLSYLCKIEKNQIEPNKAFLREICSRLELTDDKVDFLFKLKEVLTNVVKAYLIDDYDYIEYAYETGKGLDNYRFSIIKLAYYISKRKIQEAADLNDNIFQIISNLSDYDLMIFALFSSILLMLKFEFKEAIANIEYIDPSCCSKEVGLLKAIIEFKLHYAMNMADTPMYYEEAKKCSYEFGYFNIIEKLNYYIALYYIKNKCEHSYDLVISTMNNKKLVNSLRCIKAFLDNNITVLLNSDKNLNEFAGMLKLLCVNHDEAIEKINNTSLDYYKDDYDQLFLDYLALTNISDKHKFIFDKGLPLATKFSDSFLCSFFLDELLKMSKSKKYRSLSQGYSMVHDEYFNMGEFEVMQYEE